MNNPLSLIADVAERMAGFQEVSNNRAPWLPEIWNATVYKDGMTNREPYCCAAVCYWIQQADKRSKDIELRSPPVTPSCLQLLEWFKKPEQGCTIFEYDKANINLLPRRGDIVFFHFKTGRHVGIVTSEFPYTRFDVGDSAIGTIEANTSPTDQGSQRNGDGIWRKERSVKICQEFVRIPARARRV